MSRRELPLGLCVACLVVAIQFCVATTSARGNDSFEQPTAVEQLVIDTTRVYWSTGRAVYLHDLATGATRVTMIAPPNSYISRLIAENGTLGVEATLARRSRTTTIVYRIDIDRADPRRVSTTTLKSGRGYTCGQITQLGDVSPDRMIVLITHRVRQRNRHCRNHRSGTEIAIVGRRANGKIGEYFYYDRFRNSKFPFFSRLWGFISSVDVERTDAVIGGNAVQYTKDSWSRLDELVYHDPDRPRPILYTPDLSAGGKLVVPAYNLEAEAPSKVRLFVGKRNFKRESVLLRLTSRETEDPNGYLTSREFADGMRFCGEQLLGMNLVGGSLVRIALLTIVWPSSQPLPAKTPTRFLFWTHGLAEGTLRPGTGQLANAACDNSRVVYAINNSQTSRSTFTVRELSEFPPGPYPAIP